MYLEYSDEKKRPIAKVFSTTNSSSELDKFRCQVKAPKASYIQAKGERPHVVLFGVPREQAYCMLAKTFSNPKARKQWEYEEGLAKAPEEATDEQRNLQL